MLLVVVPIEHRLRIFLTHPGPLIRRFILGRLYAKAGIKIGLIDNLHLTLGSTMLGLRTLQQLAILVVPTATAFRIHDAVDEFLI